VVGPAEIGWLEIVGGRGGRLVLLPPGIAVGGKPVGGLAGRIPGGGLNGCDCTGTGGGRW
jgi:hypothetical protein